MTPEPGQSPAKDAWLRLCRNPLALGGGIAVAILGAVCALGPWLLNLSYQAQGTALGAVPPGTRIVRIYAASNSGEPREISNLPHLLAGPEFSAPAATPSEREALKAGHPVRLGELVYRPARAWLGTDVLGRDLFARILYGGRISLMVGLVATIVALVIGVTYGAVAGFLGGQIDNAMMRVVDIIYALPFIIFVILLMVFFGNLSPFPGWNLVLLFAAIGAVEWLTMARIVRGQVLSVKRMEYIEAARALGFGRRRIIFRHIIPNVLGPIVVYATLTIPSVMLTEAFLSFLGLGVQAPMSSWGVLIKDGADKMEEYWWLLVFPGAIFSLTLFSLNFLGDGLRDALDVRAAKD